MLSSSSNLDSSLVSGRIAQSSSQLQPLSYPSGPTTLAYTSVALEPMMFLSEFTIPLNHDPWELRPPIFLHLSCSVLLTLEICPLSHCIACIHIWLLLAASRCLRQQALLAQSGERVREEAKLSLKPPAEIRRSRGDKGPTLRAP